MYGKYVEGLGNKEDKYGQVKETEIRISTGLALILALFSFVSIVFYANFTISMWLIILIWADFMLKTFVAPKFSIFGSIVRPFLSDTKNWVGAVQKRFAWGIGVFLSTFVVFCVLIISGTLNEAGIMTEVYTEYLSFPIFAPMMIPMNPAILACLLCIIFMTLESVFGYCVGCQIYKKLVQKNIIKSIDGQACPDGVCKI